MVETELANYCPDVVVSCSPSDDEYVEHQPCFVVEVWHRVANGWSRHDDVGWQDVPVECLGVAVPIAEMVAGVTTFDG